MAAVMTRVGYRVKQIQQLLRHACDDALRATGTSMSQYAVLAALAEAPGASSAELARRCFVTRQSLGEMLSGLRAAGLVTLADAAAGGRPRPVALTEPGRARLAEADAVVAEVEERMLGALTLGQRAALAELLAACARNLDGAVQKASRAAAARSGR